MRMRAGPVVGLLPLLAACGVAVQSGATSTPDVPLESGLTFAWHQEGDRVLGDPRLADNRFFEESLHDAVEFELSLRGIHEDDSSPDLLIHHHLSVSGHESEAEITGADGTRETQVIQFDEGSVVVHIHYPDHREFWIGWAYADLEPALAGPDSMRGWVQRLVHQMFRTWPVPERPTG